MDTIRHPVSGETIIGYRLPPGVIIEAGDKYDSTAGKWETNPHVVGQKIEEGCSTIWVRQLGEMTEDAQNLLSCLASSSFEYIVERGGQYYTVPSPDFNWDSRIEVGRVLHSECISDLVVRGFLRFERVPMRDLHPDYSPNLQETFNNVYRLTDFGREKGEEILVD